MPHKSLVVASQLRGTSRRDTAQQGLGLQFLQCLQAMTAVKKAAWGGKHNGWARVVARPDRKRKAARGRDRRLCRIYRKVLNGRAASRDVSQGSLRAVV